ncbi:hypothetical protein KIW84_060663 [Lathyrus oleraceus]|uniref:Uncharacterized protein n=1 Tax=Pisum sativum TaxID=3888 RepID=A0A9D5A5H8_PEA|nr:hypothetical protein KIW84_060663 [Pisum sativum]
MEAFLALVDLSDVALVQTLVMVMNEPVSCFTKCSFFFQRKNTRSLIRKVVVFQLILECLNDSGSKGCNLSSTDLLCLKELYLLLYRSKILLDYCDVGLSKDGREQIEFLLNQSRRAKLLINVGDDSLRIQFFLFLDEFENGKVPKSDELQWSYVEKLWIGDVGCCIGEIEALEEHVVNHEGDIEPTIYVLKGLVAMARYCRFFIFGFEEDELDLENGNHKKSKMGLITQEIVETFLIIPKDFFCPISLDRYCRFFIFGFEEDELALENGNHKKPKMGLITQEIVETFLIIP